MNKILRLFFFLPTTFGTKYDQLPSTPVTSRRAYIKGNPDDDITVVGGLVSKDGGAFTASPGKFEDTRFMLCWGISPAVIDAYFDISVTIGSTPVVFTLCTGTGELPANDLVGLWRVDSGGLSTVIPDQSGNGNDILVSGVAGNCCNCQYGNVNVGVISNIDSDITFTISFKPNAGSLAVEPVIFGNYAPGIGQSFSIYLGSAGQLGFRRETSAGDNFIETTSGVIVAEGEYTVGINFVRSTGLVTITVGGVVVRSATITNYALDILHSDLPFYIGSNGTYEGNNFAGKIWNLSCNSITFPLVDGIGGGEPHTTIGYQADGTTVTGIITSYNIPLFWSGSQDIYHPGLIYGCNIDVFTRCSIGNPNNEGYDLLGNQLYYLPLRKNPSCAYSLPIGLLPYLSVSYPWFDQSGTSKKLSYEDWILYGSGPQIFSGFKGDAAYATPQTSGRVEKHLGIPFRDTPSKSLEDNLLLYSNNFLTAPWVADTGVTISDTESTDSPTHDNVWEFVFSAVDKSVTQVFPETLVIPPGFSEGVWVKGVAGVEISLDAGLPDISIFTLTGDWVFLIVKNTYDNNMMSKFSIGTHGTSNSYPLTIDVCSAQLSIAPSPKRYHRTYATPYYVPVFNLPPALRNVLPNGLAQTPLMGFCTWTNFKTVFDETVIQGLVDAIVSSGMKDAGYEYIQVSAGWSTWRDANGYFQNISTKFPNGMKSIGDYIHAAGLKFGLYLNPGLFGNSGPGSGGHERRDIEQLASWGVDYIMLDWGVSDTELGGYMDLYGNETITRSVYQYWAELIQSVGRPMALMVGCNGGRGTEITYGAPGWARSAGWNDARTTGDVTTLWSTIVSLVFGNPTNPVLGVPGPGYFNNVDFMPLGIAPLTDTENQSIMAATCLLTSPIMASNDLRSMSAATIATLTDPDIIAVNQYPYTQATEIIRTTVGDGTVRVWAKDMGSGTYAIGFFNLTSTAQDITFAVSELGATGSHDYEDIFGFQKGALVASGASVAISDVPSHGCSVLLMSA